MIDTQLFKLMVEKQNEWRKQYYANKRNKHIIKTVCNRRYKSKGNKNMEEIKNALLEMGFLDELILKESGSGELCYESLYGK